MEPDRGGGAAITNAPPTKRSGVRCLLLRKLGDIGVLEIAVLKGRTAQIHVPETDIGEAAPAEGHIPEGIRPLEPSGGKVTIFENHAGEDSVKVSIRKIGIPDHTVPEVNIFKHAMS